jgi:choline dehydrogenase-like flavoprotein
VKLTIVGAGVGGSALAREATARGHDVKVIAAGKPLASYAALAILRPSYVAAGDAAQAVEYALQRYREAECEVVAGAFVSGSKQPEPRLENGWWAVDGRKYLIAPNVTEHVEHDYVDPNADFTVHATGPALPGKHTWGYTWVSPYPDSLNFDGLRVHRFAPYRSVDAVAYKSSCRIGSSSAVSQATAQKQAQDMFWLAQDLGWVNKPRDFVLVSGVRVAGGAVGGLLLPSGAWQFGGFHRSGWALAPIRARQLVEELESTEL